MPTTTKTKAKKAPAISLNPRLSFQRASLVNVLSALKPFIPRKPSNPFYGNYLFQGDEGIATLSVTDGDLQVSLQTEYDGPMATFMLPPIATRLINQIDGDNVHFEMAPNGQIILANELGRVGVIDRIDEEPHDWFTFEPDGEIEMAGNHFKHCLDYLLPFASTDETKMVLTSIHLANNLHATDGHRATQLIVGWDGIDVNVPAKGIQRLYPTIPDGGIKLEWAQNMFFRLSSEGLRFTTRLVDGQYPNVDQLVPKSRDFNLQFDRAQLLSDLEYVMVIASENNNVIKMLFDKPTVHIAAETAGVGSSVVDTHLEFSGGDKFTNNTIGFNGKYLIETLEALSTPTVTLGMASSNAPVLVTCEDPIFHHIVMPVQIRE
jgi:DNA polymerase III subunit beta